MLRDTIPPIHTLSRLSKYFAKVILTEIWPAAKSQDLAGEDTIVMTQIG